jgi:hypothetical protein
VPAVAVAPAEFDRAYGERALDDVIVQAWEELAAHQGTVCPVCGGEMEPEYGAHARPVAGRCRSCTARLS